jgi:Flp pilus assembly protein TadG
MNQPGGAFVAMFQRSRFAERIRARSQEQGQALIMVSIMIMVLIGFVAIATDTGFIWMNRRSLQNAADAGALAGVQQLPEDAGTATSIGCDYAATKNGIPGMTGKTGTCSGKADVQIKTTYFTNDTIKVTAYKQINPIFGIALGFGSVQIGASATALVGSVGSACGVPLFQTVDLLQAGGVWGSSGVILNKPTIMKTSDSSSGNFLGLQVNGSSSASDLRNALGNGARCVGDNAPEYSGSATTNPGNMDGPIDQGMADRQAGWTAQGNCLSNYATDYLRSDGQLWKYPLGTAGNILFTPESCYRMAVIPILKGNIVDYASFKGSKTAPILGFAIFYIANWCGNSSTPKVQSGTCPAPAPIANPDGSNTTFPPLNKAEIWGYYVGFVAASDDYLGYNGLGTKVFVLID